MRDPVRTTAGWLAGRMVLLVLIVAALVVHDVYRDESSELAARVKGIVPDASLLDRLTAGRSELESYARARAEDTNRRLRVAGSQSSANIGRRIAEIRTEIAQRSKLRRNATQRAVALLTGAGFEEDLRNEVEIELLTAELAALQRLEEEIDELRRNLGDSVRSFEAARRGILRDYRAYLDRKAEADHYEATHGPWVRLPLTGERTRHLELRREEAQRLAASRRAAEAYWRAKRRLEVVRASRRPDSVVVESVQSAALQPLDDLITARQATLASVGREVEKIKASVKTGLATALAILVGVTLLPVGIKAFWYYVVAPAASRRSPIRLLRRVSGTSGATPVAPGEPPARTKLSAVSQEVTIGDQEELLVHPDFLQSSSDRGRADTRWLLDWTLPFTSIAARMVALTRLRTSTTDSFVVSSKTDPLAEVAVIALPQDGALVLQPRYLVGVVQRVDRPVAIRRRWQFNLTALITLQFRYLLFHGPGTLIVQGCRGVRVEPAGHGRSIDQNATIGFSANLDYSPRRSETFGAYLMGMRGLFNDNFAGGPGIYLYEEMPYRGRRSGMTGRGLEGLTDAVLKVFGI